MVLDSEEDRQLLLEIMSKAQIVGKIALQFVDLVTRLQMAKIESTAGPAATTVATGEKLPE